MERLSDRLLAWASLIDDKTVERARTSARMPFIHPHLALMPDAHLGKGATVGSVVPRSAGRDDRKARRPESAAGPVCAERLSGRGGLRGAGAERGAAR